MYAVCFGSIFGLVLHVCVLEGVVFSVCSVLWLYIQFSATCVCFGVVAYCLWCGTRHGF